MIKSIFSLSGVFLSLVLMTKATWAAAKPSGLVSKILIGSCNSQKKKMEHWRQMSKENSDMMLLLGDNIYADHQDPIKRRASYNKVKEDKYFQILQKNNYLTATWDDHDYAYNDISKPYKYAKESQQIFLDFIGAGENDERRSREGIYHSLKFDSPSGQVQLIVLDLRYFKRKNKLLGESQWQWLEHELQDNTAPITLIVSSMIFLQKNVSHETWQEHPGERQKLVNILKDRSGKQLILSGDRHYAEVSHLPGTNIYEVTASGLTHSRIFSAKNDYRVSKQLKTKNYGIINLKEDKVEIIIKKTSGKPIYSISI